MYRIACPQDEKTILYFDKCGNKHIRRGGEEVLSLPNDSFLLGAKDAGVCISLKMGIDTPIVSWAAKFFRYLLAFSNREDSKPPVIVFAHSQGAIISEHALKLLNTNERQKIRIFTFGGGSFLEVGSCHLRFKKKKKSFCMSDCLHKVSLNHNLKRRAKICAVVWTIIYSLLFPLLAYFALFSAMVFDKPDLSVLKRLSIIFILSLIPLSLPISIDLQSKLYLFIAIIIVLYVVCVELAKKKFLKQGLNKL